MAIIVRLFFSPASVEVGLPCRSETQFRNNLIFLPEFLMMRKIYIIMISAVIMSALISCENRKLNYREINISYAPYIKTGDLNLKDFAVDVEPDPSSRYTLSIIIYDYSQGKETISMSGDSGFVTETGLAEIKALVKIVDGGRVVRAEFVEASGGSTGELLRNLARSVSSLKGE